MAGQATNEKRVDRPRHSLVAQLHRCPRTRVRGSHARRRRTAYAGAASGETSAASVSRSLRQRRHGLDFDWIDNPSRRELARARRGGKSELLPQRHEILVLAEVLDPVAFNHRDDAAGRRVMPIGRSTSPSGVVHGPVNVPVQVTSRTVVLPQSSALVTVPWASGIACLQPLKRSTISSSPSARRPVATSS